MKSIKSIAIFIILFSILFLGCIEPKPVGTPVPTISPTSSRTTAPTIIPTTIATPVPTPVRLPETYESLVDGDYGFYEVVNMNATLPVAFDESNRTLSIKAGDNIIFVNYPSGNIEDVLTIVSKEGLWDNVTARLPEAYKQFNHTFNETGSFTVYVKEFEKLPPLKIIVTS